MPLPAELQTDGRDIAPEIGALAPDFELDTLNGGRFRLSDLRGRPLVVNFWASWCSPCRREVPALIRAQNAHEETGLLVIGVNIEEPRSAAQAFRRRVRRQLSRPHGFRRRRLPRLRIGGLPGPPRTFFINADGVITKIYAGQAPDEQIAQDAAAHAALP